MNISIIFYVNSVMFLHLIVFVKVFLTAPKDAIVKEISADNKF